MEVIGCDLFHWSGKDYLALVDRYSGYIWFKQLRHTAMTDVAKVLLDIFESYGYPLVIESDNGPQFRESFKAFCKGIGMTHMPSSAYNPASNGLSESAVKIAKHILQRTPSSPPKLGPPKFINREEKASAYTALKESTYKNCGGTILAQLPQGSSAVLQELMQGDDPTSMGSYPKDPY